MHDVNVCHGNICTENVGLTSWNYVVFMDICGYRPVCIPDDDPSDWIYYFQERNWDFNTIATVSGVSNSTLSLALSSGGDHATGKNTNPVR